IVSPSLTSRSPISTLFPYTTLFRSDYLMTSVNVDSKLAREERKTLFSLISEIDEKLAGKGRKCLICCGHGSISVMEEGKLVEYRSEEHTSELQSRENLVCRLLLEKK